MTVIRDLYAKFVLLKLQADGPSSGRLVDYARAPRTILTDATVDLADVLYGSPAITNFPSVSGLQFPLISCIEGFVKFPDPLPSGFGSMFGMIDLVNYSKPAEYVLRALGSSEYGGGHGLHWYNGTRGSNQFQQDLQKTDGDLPRGNWVHFFVQYNNGATWWGIDGKMYPGGSANSLGVDHYGNATIPLVLRDYKTDGSGDPFTDGRIHSLMITGTIVTSPELPTIYRYPYTGDGATYTVPNDLLTNWYHDTGVGDDPPPPPLPSDFFNVPTIRGVRIESVGRNGYGKISGHVTYNGANSVRRVDLFLRGSRILVGSTLSASNGYFEFTGLDESQEFYVAGFDDNPGSLNAEIADHLVPVSM